MELSAVSIRDIDFEKASHDPKELWNEEKGARLSVAIRYLNDPESLPVFQQASDTLQGRVQVIQDAEETVVCQLYNAVLGANMVMKVDVGANWGGPNGIAGQVGAQGKVCDDYGNQYGIVAEQKFDRKGFGEGKIHAEYEHRENFPAGRPN